MRRLPAPLWALARRFLPIACVDVLPYRRGPGGVEIGLIQRRATTSDDLAWGLVGGRVGRDETLTDAIARHVRETLGPRARFTPPDVQRPARIGEYFPAPAPGFLLDPRQHSVALTYLLEVEGEVVPRGEPADFRWWPASGKMPEPQVAGHDAVLQALLADPRLG